MSPSVSFLMDHRFIEFDKYPKMTLMAGISRVGGLIAIFKVFQLTLYVVHQKLFERSLRKESREKALTSSKEIRDSE
jgi:hypothetical protein